MGIKTLTICDILANRILKENLMPKMSERLRKIGHIVTKNNVKYD